MAAILPSKCFISLNTRLPMKFKRLNLSPLKSPIYKYYNTPSRPIKRRNFHVKSSSRSTSDQEDLTIQRSSDGIRADSSGGGKDEGKDEGKDGSVPQSYPKQDYRKYCKFQVIPEAFFTLGRMFTVLQLCKPGPSRDRSIRFQSVRGGEFVHSYYQKFVVVDEAVDQDFCYCCPIHDADKPIFGAVSQQILLRSTRDPLCKHEIAPQITRHPLAVHIYSSNTLVSRWRANLGLIQPIWYRERVRMLGHVQPSSLARLLRYRQEVHESSQAGRRIYKPITSIRPSFLAA